MKKALMFSLLGLFAVSLVVASGYLVNSFVITTDVYEPLEVEYAIIGDGGNWDGVTTCQDLAVDSELWHEGQNVDVGGLYAGEGRVICAKITNLGEGDIDYTFSGEVIDGTGCEEVFGSEDVLATGTVPALATVQAGGFVVLSDDAPPVDDCQLELSLFRG